MEVVVVMVMVATALRMKSSRVAGKKAKNGVVSHWHRFGLFGDEVRLER